MTHARQFAVTGGLLGFGAPAGLLLLRWAARGDVSGGSFLADELVADPLLYTYVTFGTVLAMAVFGWALGVKEDALEALSLTDTLTGLWNRRQFDQRLGEEVARAARYRTPLTLLILDIDRFKAVNDRWGHLQGDRVLREIAGTVRDSFRRTDVVCRYGGEEIAIIAPNTELEEARAFAERARERVASMPIAVREGDAAEECRVTVSIGLAGVSPDGRTDASTLTGTADEALYTAKMNGRNRCHVAGHPAGANEASALASRSH